MKRTLLGKSKIKTMLALMLAFVLCASVVPAFAMDDSAAKDTSGQTESVEQKAPDQGTDAQADGTDQASGTETPAAEPEKTDTPETTDPAQADGTETPVTEPEQPVEKPLLKAAPPLKASTSIGFRSSATAGCRQFWSSGGEGYVGTCCQPGVTPDDSGTATMSKFSNTSLTAKLAYQYGYKNNWIRSYAVLDGFQNLTNAARFMYMIQMSQVGENQWNSWAVNNNFSQRVRTNSINMYHSASAAVANLTVPDGFECYLCYPSSGHQRFILYKYTEPPKSGFVKAKKVSANTDITG